MKNARKNHTIFRGHYKKYRGQGKSPVNAFQKNT